MADIVLLDVFEAMRGEFGAGGAAGVFEQMFVRAVNNAVNRINRRADTSTAISQVVTHEETVGLDERYLEVLEAGIRYFLSVRGVNLRGDPKKVPIVNELRSSFDNLIGEYQSDIRNDDQASPEDNTVAGLGANYTN